MTRTLARTTLAALAITALALTGCSSEVTVVPDDQYDRLKGLITAFEHTEFAAEYSYECDEDTKFTHERAGYEDVECHGDRAFLRVRVATADHGLDWIEEHPELQAMERIRGVIKGVNWQVTGEVPELQEVQEELGGQLYRGTRLN